MLVELIWLLGVFPQLKNWHAYSFSHQFNQIRKNFIALSDRFKVAHIKIPANYTQCLRTFGSSGSTVQTFFALNFFEVRIINHLIPEDIFKFWDKKTRNQQFIKKKTFSNASTIFVCCSKWTEWTFISLPKQHVRFSSTN